MNQKHEHILLAMSPLNTLFGQMPDDKAKLYCEALTHYDIDIIRRAVKQVSDKFEPSFKVPFPAVATLKKVCEEMQQLKSPYSSQNLQGQNMSTVQAADRKKLVDEYWKSFRQCNIAIEARAGGYEYELEKYVREIASVQAQMIIPCAHNGLGLSWHIIQVDGLTREQQDGWQREFLHEMRRLLSMNKNSIDVQIPSAKIEQWKREAEREKQIHVQKQAANTPYGKDIKESLQNVRQVMQSPIEDVAADIHSDFLP